MSDDILRADDEAAKAITELIQWWRRDGYLLTDSRPRIPRVGPPVPFHRGIAKGTIRPGTGSTGGKVHLLLVRSTGGRYEDTGSTETAYDTMSLGCGASSGEEVFLFRHQQSGKLQAFALPSQRCRGQVTSSSTGGSGNMTVNRVEPFLGASPTSSSAATLTVQNTHSWTFSANAFVKFERRNNSTGLEWDAYQVDCPNT